MSGRKLHTLPLKRKIKLIDAVEKRPAGKKKKEIAEEFGIVPNTLSTIVKDKEKYRQAFTLVLINISCVKVFGACHIEPILEILDK